MKDDIRMNNPLRAQVGNAKPSLVNNGYILNTATILNHTAMNGWWFINRFTGKATRSIVFS